jgi:hypothetical protein
MPVAELLSARGGPSLVPHPAATRSRQLHPVRFAVFLALLAAHVLAVLYFASDRMPAAVEPDNGFTTTVFFLAPAAPAHLARVTQLPPRTSFAPQRRAPSSQPEQSQSTTTAPVAIDWAKEAERVATDPALSVGAVPAPAARHQFEWDHARTNRLEQLPGGGLLVNLNDRCAIVFEFPMLLGGCKLGKIDARGDLFAHMHDDP